MFLTIALRKEVVDVAEAQVLVDLVKEKIPESAEVTITASYSEQIEPTEI